MAEQGFEEIKFARVGWYDDPDNPTAVQVLTERLLKIKSKGEDPDPPSHKLFEEWRAHGTSPARKAELERQLIEIWRKYPVPGT
jgi:hypothetical protein